jgi:hypothetical protein
MSSSKRHFTAVIGNKEQGTYVSSSPSSAARKAVSKLCADDKNRKVKFSIRETTRDSNKKVYGPYIGYMQKLDKPIELKGRVIKYKPVAKLDKKISKMKGGVIIGKGKEGFVIKPNINSKQNNEVSKLIKIRDELEIKKIMDYEGKLIKIDPSGNYHIPIIAGRRYNPNNINKNNLDSNINKIKELKIFNPNYKITYLYGGISIDTFLENFENYSSIVNKDYCKKILLGIVNIFVGLYIFYINKIHHVDLHQGNIVFLIDNPEIMRMIDMQDYGINSGNKVFIWDLIHLDSIIIILINKFLEVFKDDPEFIAKLSEFLNIHELKQYIKSNAKVFEEKTFERIKAEMEAKIDAM